MPWFLGTSLYIFKDLNSLRKSFRTFGFVLWVLWFRFLLKLNIPWIVMRWKCSPQGHLKMSKSVLDFQGRLFHLNCRPEFSRADHLLKAWKRGNMYFLIITTLSQMGGTVSLIWRWYGGTSRWCLRLVMRQSFWLPNNIFFKAGLIWWQFCYTSKTPSGL